MLSATSLTPASLDLHCQGDLDSVRHTLTAKWRYDNMVAGISNYCPIATLFFFQHFIRHHLQSWRVWRIPVLRGGGAGEEVNVSECK